MQGQLRNQLHALGHMPVVIAQDSPRMEALDQTLTAQIADIVTELVAWLPTEEASEEGAPSLDRAWALTLARLQTIPGIGFLTAFWIIVTAMNFSLCSSAEQAIAYAGLAPMARASASIPVLVTRATGDCEQPSTWQPFLPHATTLSSTSFMTGCT